MMIDDPDVLIGEIVDDENFSEDNFERTGSYSRAVEPVEENAETKSKLRAASENINSLNDLLGKFRWR